MATAGNVLHAEPSYASLLAASESSSSTSHLRDIHMINTYPPDSRISPHTLWHVRTWPAVRPVDSPKAWIIKAKAAPQLCKHNAPEGHMFGTVGQHWPGADVAVWSTSTVEPTSKLRATPVLAAGSYRDMFIQHQLLHRTHLPARDPKHPPAYSSLPSHEQGPSWSGKVEVPRQLSVQPPPPQQPRTHPPPSQTPPSQPLLKQPLPAQPLHAQPSPTQPSPSQPPPTQPSPSQLPPTQLPPSVSQPTQSPPSQPPPPRPQLSPHARPLEACKSQVQPTLLNGYRIITLADSAATSTTPATIILQPDPHASVAGLPRAVPHQLNRGADYSRAFDSGSGATVSPRPQRPFIPPPDPQPLPPHLRSVIGSIADVRPAEMPPELCARPDPVLLTQLAPLHTLPSTNQLAAGLSSLKLRMDCAVHSLSTLSSLSCLASLACLQPVLDPAAATTAARAVAIINSYGEADSCVAPAAAADWRNEQFGLGMDKPFFAAQGSTAEDARRADSTVAQDPTPPSGPDAVAGLRKPACRCQLSRPHSGAETGANGGCNNGSGEGGMPGMARHRLIKTWPGGVLADCQQLLRPAPLTPADIHPPNSNTRSSAPRSSHMSVTKALSGNTFPVALHADGGHGGYSDAATAAAMTASAAAAGTVSGSEMIGGGTSPPDTRMAQRPEWTDVGETVAAAVVLSGTALQQLVAETARASAAAALELYHTRHVLQLQQQLRDNQPHQSKTLGHLDYHEPHNQLEATLSFNRQVAPQLHSTSVDVPLRGIWRINNSAVCSDREGGGGKAPVATALDMEQPQVGRVGALDLESCGISLTETTVVGVPPENVQNGGGDDAGGDGAGKLGGQGAPLNCDVTTTRQQQDRQHTQQGSAAASTGVIRHQNSGSGSCDGSSSTASWDYITLYPTQVIYVGGTERLDVKISDSAPAAPSGQTPSAAALEGHFTVQETQEVEVGLEKVDELQQFFPEAGDGSEPRRNSDNGLTGFIDGVPLQLPGPAYDVGTDAREASPQIHSESNGRDRASDGSLLAVGSAAGISDGSANAQQVETKSRTAATIAEAAEQWEAERVLRQPPDSTGNDSRSSSRSSSHGTGSIRAGAAHPTRDMRTTLQDKRGRQELEENSAARGEESPPSPESTRASYRGPPHDDGSRNELRGNLSGEGNVEEEHAEMEEENGEDGLAGLEVAPGRQDAVQISTGISDADEHILASGSASYVDNKDADIPEEESLQQRAHQMEDDMYGDSTDVWKAEAGITGERLLSEADTDAEDGEGPVTTSEQQLVPAAAAKSLHQPGGDVQALRAAGSGIGHEASDQSLSFSISFSTLVVPDASSRNRQNNARSGVARSVPVLTHSSMPSIVKR